MNMPFHAQQPNLVRLEQVWVRFQLDVASLRPALGPLYNAAKYGRRAHTFFSDQEPEHKFPECKMGPTAHEPNGVPDLWNVSTGGSYAGRAISVASASTILQAFDTAIQALAHELGFASGANMSAGDDIPFTLSANPVKASTLIWAGANNVRHIEEWASTTAAFLNPRTADDRRLKSQQRRSMAPLAAVFSVKMPVVENVAFEVFGFLTKVSEEQGTYDRLELHVLRIGQDLIRRAGLDPAPIGVTLRRMLTKSEIAGTDPNRVTISDGIGRTASSVEDVGHAFNVRPLSDDSTEESGTESGS